MVPLYRKKEKKLNVKLIDNRKRYMEEFITFESKIKKVINALNETADTVAENVDVFVQKQKEALRKERQAAIDQLKEVLISRKMISKKYADQFVFDEKWLKMLALQRLTAGMGFVISRSGVRVTPLAPC